MAVKFVQVAVCEGCNLPILNEPMLTCLGITQDERVVAAEGAYHARCLVHLVTALRPAVRPPAVRGAPSVTEPDDAPTLIIDEYTDPDALRPPPTPDASLSTPTPRAPVPVPTGHPIAVKSRVMLTPSAAANYPRLRNQVGTVSRFLEPPEKNPEIGITGVWVDFPHDSETFDLEDLVAVAG